MEFPKLSKSMFQLKQPKTYFLVDVENFGKRWLDYLHKEENAQILLFFSNPSPNMSLQQLCTVANSSCRVESFSCYTGPQALDFQLSSYLGFLIASSVKDDQFIILSNDKGYEAVCKFWCNKGYKVARVNVDNPPKAKVDTVTPKKAPSKAKKDVWDQYRCLTVIRQYLPKKGKQHADQIFRLLVKNKKSSKQKIYQDFVKMFGQEDGQQYYKCVRPVIKTIQTKLVLN